jgi:hypothetical protein
MDAMDALDAVGERNVQLRPGIGGRRLLRLRV